MLKALILIADGTEEIEFVTAYDVLVRAGFEVVSAGVELAHETLAVCSRHIRIQPDHPTLLSVPSASAHQHFDVLILPGGADGAKTFTANVDVLALVRAFRAEGKVVAGICAAVTALVKAGGEKVAVTSHPSVEGVVREMGWGYSEERVVVSQGKGGGNVVTSRGPGTALLFALTLVELLAGKEKRDEVAGPMVLADVL